MAEFTKIEWATHTWNVWRGCTKVSAGCKNCYAEANAKRNPLTLGVWGDGGTRVVAAAEQWDKPAKWNRTVSCNVAHGGPRPRVFVNSIADVFEDWVGAMVDHAGRRMTINPDDFGFETVPAGSGREWLTMGDVRARMMKTIGETENLDYLFVTKRPENFAALMRDALGRLRDWADVPEPNAFDVAPFRELHPNVWFGTTVEDQAAANARIPHLLKAEAAVRFLSVEPLLGPVDLTRYVYDRRDAVRKAMRSPMAPNRDQAESMVPECGIDWVIVGGESGHGARPCRVDWIRDVVRQCQAAGVAVFVKQLGANYTDENNGVCGLSTKWPFDVLPAGPARRLDDPKGGTIEEFPADLRVREFPKGAAKS